MHHKKKKANVVPLHFRRKKASRYSADTTLFCGQQEPWIKAHGEGSSARRQVMQFAEER